MFLSLRERKGEFWYYDGFVARIVDMNVCFENCDVMPFMPRCELCDWKYCDEKLCSNVALSMVRMIMIE